MFSYLVLWSYAINMVTLYQKKQTEDVSTASKLSIIVLFKIMRTFLLNFQTVRKFFNWSLMKNLITRNKSLYKEACLSFKNANFVKWLNNCIYNKKINPTLFWSLNLKETWRVVFRPLDLIFWKNVKIIKLRLLRYNL